MASEHTILVAVDKSQISEDAFNFYLDTLHQSSHKIIFVHVAELYQSQDFAMSPAVIMGEWKKEEEKSKELFEKYRRIASAKGVSGTQMLLKKGMNPGHIITEAAKEKHASSVVMGTRGMGTIRRTIMGSVSDYVLHHAHCPVIICRQ